MKRFENKAYKGPSMCHILVLKFCAPNGKPLPASSSAKVTTENPARVNPEKAKANYPFHANTFVRE
jgi:hypothetical protein